MEAKPQFHGSDTAAVAAFYHVPVDEIVQEIVGEFGRDSPRLTEHQQSGSCGTHLRTINAVTGSTP